MGEVYLIQLAQRGISTPVVCILPKDEKRVRLPYPAQDDTKIKFPQN